MLNSMSFCRRAYRNPQSTHTPARASFWCSVGVQFRQSLFQREQVAFCVGTKTPNGRDTERIHKQSIGSDADHRLLNSGGFKVGDNC